MYHSNIMNEDSCFVPYWFKVARFIRDMRKYAKKKMIDINKLLQD